MRCNKLTINYAKSKYILFTNDKVANFNVFMNNNLIERVHNIKYLGIYIESDLTWVHHINHLVIKLRQACGLIYKLRHFVSMKCLITVYYSFVFSYLKYGILTYGSAKKTILYPLQVLQRRAVRAITLFGSLKNIHVNTDIIFRDLNILTLDRLFKLELYKIKRIIHVS